MDASTTAGPLSQPLEIPSWKHIAGFVAALFVAILFIGAGAYKAVDPYRWSRMLEELLFPSRFSLPFTLLLAVGEMFGGALILVPRFRRWGAALTAFLLVAFMAYIGIHYTALIGKDCSCFPWIKRTVGPMFFVGDGAFLAAALLAGLWAQPVSGKKRTAAVMLGVVAVFTGVSFGSALAHQTGTKAPDTVLVDDKPFSLQHGRIVAFFYDPECPHCEAAARHMSKVKWIGDVTVVALPVRVPQFAADFLKASGLKAVTSTDWKKLKATFPYGDPPYAVAIENGREKGPIQHFDDEDNGTEPAATLRQLGFIE
jgi:uncharacterized membrane protein YphA (DoxX/SURF4 family)